jgi:hypothetical protein
VIQQSYNGLRKNVEAVLSYPSVDDCSTMHVDDSTMPIDDSPTMPVGGSSTLPVDPSKHDQILSALERIRDEREDATYGATVDEVLDKILDNAIEAHGSSARDVYRNHLPGSRRKTHR